MNRIALDFIKSHERCRLTAYRDQGGKWTVGWGATGPEISAGTVWTQGEADADLARRVAAVETSVGLKLVSLKLSVPSSAALISFAYNVGVFAFGTSHVLQFLLARDFINAAKALLAWDHVNGIESAGLLKRRMAEGALLLDGLA